MSPMKAHDSPCFISLICFLLCSNFAVLNALLSAHSSTACPHVASLCITRSSSNASVAWLQHGFWYRQEFTDAWQKVALASNFHELRQQSQHQSDAQTSFMLRQTPLCEAAYRCYCLDDYNLREAFPPQQVIDLLDKIADEMLNATAKALMHGAFNQGTHCPCTCEL